MLIKDVKETNQKLLTTFVAYSIVCLKDKTR